MKKVLLIALLLFTLAALNGSWFDGHKSAGWGWDSKVASTVSITAAAAAPMQAEYLPPVGGGQTVCTRYNQGQIVVGYIAVAYWEPTGLPTSGYMTAVCGGHNGSPAWIRIA